MAHSNMMYPLRFPKKYNYLIAEEKIKGIIKKTT